MEEIIEIHQKSLNPDFIGQESTSRAIIDKASKSYQQN